MLNMTWAGKKTQNCHFSFESKRIHHFNKEVKCLLCSGTKEMYFHHLLKRPKTQKAVTLFALLGKL